MLDNGNKTYFNVSGVYISDPAINYPETLREGMREFVWLPNYHQS